MGFYHTTGPLRAISPLAICWNDFVIWTFGEDENNTMLGHDLV